MTDGGREGCGRCGCGFGCCSIMKPLACSVCLRSFPHKSDLKRHMSTIHERTQYPCHCGKVFNRKDGCVRHQRTRRKQRDSQPKLESCIPSSLTSRTSTAPSLPWFGAAIPSHSGSDDALKHQAAKSDGCTHNS